MKIEKPLIPNAPLPDSTKLLSYRIIKLIARGSSSFVYLAENKQKRLVAIKEYMPHKLFLRDGSKIDISISPNDIKEFRRYLRTFFSECRTLALVTHPTIVRRLDFFRAHNTFYLVTNYEAGSSLRDFLRRRLRQKMGYKKDSLLNAYLIYRRHKKNMIGPRQIVGERLIIKICLDVIAAISKIHDQDFIYLDLKPDNIYLRSDGNAFLLDFGATRRTLKKNRKNLNWVYTKGFAAPELLCRQRASLGPWTDSYSIGATIFACMCGHSPQSADQREMKDSVPQSIKLLRKLYSKDLLDLVECCLNLNREQRPQNMSVLQERLLACQFDVKPPVKKRLIKNFLVWLKRKRLAGQSKVANNILKDHALHR